MASTALPPLPPIFQEEGYFTASPIAVGTIYATASRIHNFKIDNKLHFGDTQLVLEGYRKLKRKNSEIFIRIDTMTLREKRIVFHLDSQTITITGESSRHISMNELTAITQKSKDLGWL